MQHATDKDLIDGVRTALVVDKTSSQQRDSMYSKERERWLADKAVVESELSKFRAETKAKIDQSQTSLDGETKRTNEIDRKRVRLLAFGKSLKRQLQLRLEDS